MLEGHRLPTADARAKSPDGVALNARVSGNDQAAEYGRKDVAQRQRLRDCATARGTKHLAEMAAMVREGHRAVMLYVIQCATPERFSLTPDLDPVYFKAFSVARKAGVEALAFTCHVKLDSIALKAQVPVIDPS